MKTFFSTLFHILGNVFLLTFLTEVFYHLSNDYFIVDNQMRDYSLYSWLMMLLMWAGSIYFWFKGRKEVLLFTVAFSTLCVVFDCYRYVAFLRDIKCLRFLQGVFAIEVVLLILATIKKQRRLIILILATMIVTVAVPVLVVPFVKVKDIYLIAGTGALIWVFSPLALRLKRAGHGITAFMLMLLLSLIFVAADLWVSWKIYEKMPGIHFYEKPYTKEVKNVRVSVIVPAYNAEDTLERTLDSLRFQTLKKIEIIVVNDGSTDKTSKILEEYAAHDVRFNIIHQKNAYAGAARNRGLKEARGEYIGFVDADDAVSPNYYKSLYNTAKANDADIAVAETIMTIYENEGGREAPYTERQGFMKDGVVIDLADYRRHVYPYLWDKIYRRSFLLKHHILCSTRRTPVEDNFLTTQALMYADKMYVAKDAVYYYYRGHYSLTVINYEKLSNPVEYVFSDLDDLIDDSNFDEAKKTLWHDVVNANRHRSFDNYYRLLKEEDKEAGLKKLQKAAPDWKPEQEGH